MRQVAGFEDKDGSTERGNLGANMGRPIVTNGGRFTIGNSHCAAARLLLGEFLLLQARSAGETCRPSARCMASTPSNAALLPRDRGQTCYHWATACIALTRPIATDYRCCMFRGLCVCVCVGHKIELSKKRLNRK